LLPHPAQARRRPQLPRSCLLAAGTGEGLVEVSFRLGRVRLGLSQPLILASKKEIALKSRVAGSKLTAKMYLWLQK